MRLTREMLMDMGVSPATIDAAIGGRDTAPRRIPTGPSAPVPSESTGAWSVVIPGWRPPSLNVYLRWHWARRRREDAKIRKVVAVACLVAGVVPATRLRQVRLTLGYARRCVPLDEDNAYKPLLDALKACGAIVDDGPSWLTRLPYEMRFDQKQTTIEIEDV